MIANCLRQPLPLLRLLRVFGCTESEEPGSMALQRLKQAMATVSADRRRDMHILVAAIVFLLVMYILVGWLGIHAEIP
jgi:hypothetical protein